MEENIITLDFEDDTKTEAEVLGTFEVGTKTYIALIDTKINELYFYIYEEMSEDEYTIHDIEDEQEYEKVFEEFERIFEEEL